MLFTSPLINSPSFARISHRTDSCHARRMANGHVSTIVGIDLLSTGDLGSRNAPMSKTSPIYVKRETFGFMDHLMRRISWSVIKWKQRLRVKQVRNHLRAPS